LLTAIEEARTRIEQLDVEQAEVKARLASLRNQLATLQAANAPSAREASAPPVNGPRTPSEKVTLFRQLFRGRQDLYPTRFVSAKTGKQGYAPACSNKFVPGVCELPRVKCGECTKQAFRPVDNDAVTAHLKGKHVMGVYPMLPDDTCWFLAADFDESSWTEDVRAFVATSRGLGLAPAVERSRSGNGAHVWFFFSGPVQASTARKMACHLITETMASRHQLSMNSYDRLFPSQDTMPRGGFGNLIALPLQYGPRQEGNTVFLDDDLVAFPDDQQWAYLASVTRIDPETVARIATEADRQGSVIGVRTADVADDEDTAPWAQLPSGSRRTSRITGPVPERISGVLAQRVFCQKEGLSSQLLNQIKRLAAFQNPEFYKKQSMRLPTALTPRVISCAEDLPQHVALPRGCVAELEALIRRIGVKLDIKDERVSGDPLRLRFFGTLTLLQEQAARALLAHDFGVLVAPPGVGKTVIGTYLVAMRACSTLVLVHRRPLLDQWRAQLGLFLGLEPKEVGQVGAGKVKLTGRVDVAMIQSLVRKDAVADLVTTYGQVIVDECHHVPAVSFERVLSAVKARYVVGLTATLQRRDGHDPIARMQLGPVRFEVSAKAQASRKPFEHRLIVRETDFRAPAAGSSSIQDLYAALACDPSRNALIVNDVVHALQDGYSPILLTERKDHLEYFATRLRHIARHLIVLQGGMGAKSVRAAREQLAVIPAVEERLVIATGRYVGEGFDDARLDTLFLALPVSWKGTLVQYTGRLHRLHPGKSEVRIFDYVDREVPMLLRMFEKRLRGYRAIGYARGEAPLAFEEPSDDSVIDYDDDDIVAELERYGDLARAENDDKDTISDES
jgi:superfamily II DNA or RNA helicase